MRGRLQLSWRGDLSQLCFLLHVLLHLLVWVMAASIKDLPYLLELLQLFSTSHMIEDTDSYILFMLRRLVYFLKFSKHPLLSWKLLFSSSPDCAQTLYNYIVFSPNTAPLTTLSVPCLPNPSPLPHTHTPWRFLQLFQKGLMKTHARNFFILWSSLYFSWSHKHCFVYTIRCRNTAILILLSILSNTFAFSKRDHTFLFFLSWGSYQHVH